MALTLDSKPDKCTDRRAQCSGEVERWKHSPLFVLIHMNLGSGR